MPVVSVPRATPLSLIVTTPLETKKLSVLNDATPLFDDVASSPSILILLLDTVVLIPSPASKVIVSPKETLSLVPVSAEIVNAVPVEVTSPPMFRLPVIYAESCTVIVFAKVVSPATVKFPPTSRLLVM